MRDAGHGRALNAFPDLYVAFYRWALWRLFDAEDATGRGVLAFITNRGFLTGRGFGGLRRMLRGRFDRIRILDLRGDSQGARPATVQDDQNVFNIQVGVCILVAYAAGARPAGEEAQVEYADAWEAGAFTRDAKLRLAAAATDDPALLRFRPVPGGDMDPLKPRGFADRDWPGVDELFGFRSNGIVTYRDDFAYAPTAAALSARIQRWLTLPLEQARAEFKDTRDRSAGPASLLPFDPAAIERISYRPLDGRYVYNRREYIDFPKPALQAVWGQENFALFALKDGTGAGPAVWCHGLKPDQHAFNNRGGWVFPFRSHNAEGSAHHLRPALVGGLAAAYGTPVAALDAFDAILALLSATSYTTRFAFDLEDDFPHVPFPADHGAFLDAARIGARIRALQGLGAAPGPAFRSARLAGRASGPALDVPAPRQAFVADGGAGTVALLPDRSLHMERVPERVWRFAVSGYPVLHRWLRARNGEALTGPAGVALQRAALDVAWRIEELLGLYDEADAVLARALAAPWRRADLGLGAAAPVIVEDDDAPA